MDRETELSHLRLADRHIAKAEERIAAQAALVERLRAGHHAVGPAEDLLQLLRETLEVFRQHRKLILAALES